MLLFPLNNKKKKGWKNLAVTKDCNMDRKGLNHREKDRGKRRPLEINSRAGTRG